MSGSDWQTLGSVAKELVPEKNEKRPPFLKTGFAELDEVLGGGLNNNLIVLGGVPGLGKSTFVLQLAEQVVEENPGTPVLYFSLEMPAESLTAKVISRHSFMKTAPKTRLKVDDMLNPEKARGLPSSVKGKLNTIIENLAESEERGKNFCIIDRNFLKRKYGKSVPFSAGAIAKVVSDFIEQQKSDEDKPDQQPPCCRPLVVVDYLQILEPEPSEKPKDTTAGTEKKKIDDSLTQFLELIDEKKIPLILISSLNRSSYNRPIQMDSFKETGGIEYSAEVLLGLQLVACRKKEGEWSLNEEQKKIPRNVEITVLKQRYGGSGDLIPFQFYPGYSCFKDKSTLQTAAKKRKGSVTEEQENEICYMNNTKIANEIRKGGTSGACAVFKDKGENVITTYELSEALTAYECNVADAIYSLYRAKQKTFTPDMVLRALSGNFGQTMSQDRRKKTTEIIEKLRRVEISIDYAKEKEKRKQGQKWGEDSSFGKKKFLFVGRKGNEYVFQEGVPLPLYYYGELTRQIISVPSQRLSMKDEGGNRRLSDTVEHINLKRFLIRRIEVAGYRNDPNSNERNKMRNNMRQISFQEGSNLLAELRLEAKNSADKQKLRRLYEAAKKILDYYKETGYIEGYEEKAVRNSPVGSIELKIRSRDERAADKPV